MKPIYLDNHATTQVDERVLKKMMPFMMDKFGNASSVDHLHGVEAKKAVEDARKEIADLIGARPAEIVFTSGATEADNMAIMGSIDMGDLKNTHIISTKIEHKAIINTLEYLERLGAEITLLDANEFGEIDLTQLQKEIKPNTKLISVILANNEVGTIQNFEGITNVAKENGIKVHFDAAQALGRVKIDVRKTPISMLSLSAHKIYGPKGIGAIFVNKDRPRVRLNPILFGGGQENNLRSGTLNVPGIVGFGEAAKLMKKEYEQSKKKYLGFRKIFEKELEGVNYKINGSENRLENNMNIWFPGVEAQALIKLISKYVSLSTGSACTTDHVEASHVLMAMFNDDTKAFESIRIGFGRFNNEAEIGEAVLLIKSGVERLTSRFSD